MGDTILKKLPIIIIEIVPLSDIPIKNEVADYRYDEHNWLRIKIAQSKDSCVDMEILMHELSEWFLNERDGITIEEVDKWDMAHVGSGAKGSVKGCPYGKNHSFANRLSRKFIEKCGYVWRDYKKQIEGKNYRELFQ